MMNAVKTAMKSPTYLKIMKLVIKGMQTKTSYIDEQGVKNLLPAGDQLNILVCHLFEIFLPETIIFELADWKSWMKCRRHKRGILQKVTGEESVFLSTAGMFGDHCTWSLCTYNYKLNMLHQTNSMQSNAGYF